METLKANIPDIASQIELPDLKKVLEFFSHDFASSGSSELNKVIGSKIASLKQAHLRE